MSQPKRSSRLSVWLSHGVTISVAAALSSLLYVGGALTALDHWIYDHCLSAAPPVKEGPPPVMLVAAGPELLATATGRAQLRSRLEQLGVRGIAWTVPPPDGEAAAEVLQGSPWIITPERYYDPRRRLSLESDTDRELQRRAPFVGFTLSDDGVLRTQQMSFSSPDGNAPSLEAAIADRWFEGTWSAPAGSFYIRYTGRGAALPTVPAEVVVNDGLVPELVQGRAVLIGPERDLGTPGLTGPLHEDVPMTPLQAHGQAVESLLTQTWVAVPSPDLSLSIAAGGSLVIYLLGVWLPEQRRRVVAAVLSLEAAGAWAALNFGHLWFSVGLLLGCQLCAAAACSAQSRWHLTKLIDRAAHQIRSRMHVRQKAAGRNTFTAAELLGWGNHSAGSSSANLHRGLDCLHFELDLLEHVFDDSGTGFALYDANGALIRMNRSLSKFVSRQLGGDAATAMGNVLASLVAGARDIRDVVTQVLQKDTSLSLKLSGEEGTAGSRIKLRPIEFSWSSPHAPVDAAEVVRTRFMICEWSLPEGAAGEGQETVEEVVDSLWSVVRASADEALAATPAVAGAASTVASSAETRDHRNPLKNPLRAAEPAFEEFAERINE